MIRHILLVIALVSVGCTNDTYSTLDAPKLFFAKHKIGSSTDYGIIKFNDPSDHVITIHGFADDRASCSEVADALNSNACEDTGGEQCLNPYSCIALNE